MVSSGETRAGLGAAIAIVLALWSASGGVGNLMVAISTAYDEEQKRSFVKKRGLALLLTLGAIIFMIVMLGLVAVFPTLLDRIDSGVVRFLLQAARWVLVAAVVSVALAVLYRVAPDRDAPKMRWVSVGAVVATVLWLIASIGFSFFGELRHVRQDLRPGRRHRGHAVLAVDHQLRRPAGCRDQRRSRAADHPRHHQGHGCADWTTGRGQG